MSQNWPSIAPGALIRETIADGVPGSLMPAWSKAKGGPLSDQDIDDIVAYIETWLASPIPLPTLRPAPVPTALPPEGIKGDPVAGAQIYAVNCAMCHGKAGEGRVGATLARNWPAIAVDEFLRETIARGVEGTLMPAWSKAYGGPLSEKEIDDVEAFLRTLKPAESKLPEPQRGGADGLLLLLKALLISAVVAIILATIAALRERLAGQVE